MRLDPVSDADAAPEGGGLSIGRISIRRHAPDWAKVRAALRGGPPPAAAAPPPPNPGGPGPWPTSPRR